MMFLSDLPMLSTWPMIEWCRQVVQVSKGNVWKIKPESHWDIFFGGSNFLFFGLTVAGLTSDQDVDK